MTKEKACKICKVIYSGDKCPVCSSKESTEVFKGKIIVLNPEKSEIAQKLNFKNKGVFAMKTK